MMPWQRRGRDRCDGRAGEEVWDRSVDILEFIQSHITLTDDGASPTPAPTKTTPAQ